MSTRLQLGQRPSFSKDAPRSQSELKKTWGRFRANRIAMVGLGFVLLIVLLAIFADFLAPYDPLAIERGMRGARPSWSHPLGCDDVGRDLLSRVIHGSRVSLVVGLVGTIVSVVIGVTIGAFAGYFGGRVDRILSILVDTLMAFPILALLILLAAILGPSLATTISVVGTTTWARYARVVRGVVLSLKEADFVLAARAVGANDLRIICRHILPNVLTPIIVLASLGVGVIIILECALSFLGLGVRPPTPSWGATLAQGRAYITVYPHISIAPGVMVFITVLAFNVFGDGLRDALDPRMRET